MLNIIQPVAILPEAAQAVIDRFSRAERAVFAQAASEPKAPPPPPGKLYNIDPETRFAIIPISGTLIARKTPCMKQYPHLFNVAACDELIRSVTDAASDREVEGIAFEIDSPGGQVTGTPEVAGAILAARELKPCVAWTGSMACSAAYWIAAQCDAVFASPSADVGSIGVFMAFVDSSRALENNGYKVELFSTGAYKGAGVTGSLTDAQREHFQARVEEIFEDFKAALAPRGIAPETMQGQTFYGAHAADARLIDGLALSLEQAIRKAKALISQ